MEQLSGNGWSAPERVMFTMQDGHKAVATFQLRLTVAPESAEVMILKVQSNGSMDFAAMQREAHDAIWRELLRAHRVTRSQLPAHMEGLSHD